MSKESTAGHLLVLHQRLRFLIPAGAILAVPLGPQGATLQVRHLHRLPVRLAPYPCILRGPCRPPQALPDPAPQPGGTFRHIQHAL